MWSLNGGGLLIKAVARAGLTVYIHVYIIRKLVAMTFVCLLIH